MKSLDRFYLASIIAQRSSNYLEKIAADTKDTFPPILSDEEAIKHLNEVSKIEAAELDAVNNPNHQSVQPPHPSWPSKKELELRGGDVFGAVKGLGKNIPLLFSDKGLMPVNYMNFAKKTMSGLGHLNKAIKGQGPRASSPYLNPKPKRTQIRAIDPTTGKDRTPPPMDMITYPGLELKKYNEK